MVRNGFSHWLAIGWPPSVDEVAYALSRVRRWNGQTVCEWSVLQHVMAVFLYGRYQNLSSSGLLYALWHDVDEICTGDIPTPFKTDIQREHGESIRREVWEATLSLEYPSPRVVEAVSHYDRWIGQHEANLFCHPRVRRETKAEDGQNDEIYDLLFWILRQPRLEEDFKIQTERLLHDVRVDTLIKGGSA